MKEKIFKISNLYLLLLILLLPITATADIALGSGWIKVNKTSALADGKDKISIKIDFSESTEVCMYPDSFGNYNIEQLKYMYKHWIDVVSGEATVSENLIKPANWIIEPTGKKGFCDTEGSLIFLTTPVFNPVFLTSTRPGKVTLRITSVEEGLEGKWIFPAPWFQPKFDFSFYANQATTSKATSTTTTATKPNLPSPPILKGLESNKNYYYAKDIKLKTYYTKDQMIFSGTTIPNGIVHLFFNSSPFEDSTTADKNGSWYYKMQKDLGPGEHTLSVAVTDPQTNLTSEKSEKQNFTLIASASTTKGQIYSPGKEAPYSSTIFRLWTALFLLMITETVLAILYFKNKKQKKRKETDTISK